MPKKLKTGPDPKEKAVAASTAAVAASAAAVKPVAASATVVEEAPAIEKEPTGSNKHTVSFADPIANKVVEVAPGVFEKSDKQEKTAPSGDDLGRAIEEALSSSAAAAEDAFLKAISKEVCDPKPPVSVITEISRKDPFVKALLKEEARMRADKIRMRDDYRMKREIQCSHDVDFLGEGRFRNEIKDILEELNIPETRINAEARDALIEAGQAQMSLLFSKVSMTCKRDQYPTPQHFLEAIQSTMIGTVKAAFDFGPQSRFVGLPRSAKLMAEAQQEDIDSVSPAEAQAALQRNLKSENPSAMEEKKATHAYIMAVCASEHRAAKSALDWCSEAIPKFPDERASRSKLAKRKISAVSGEGESSDSD